MAEYWPKVEDGQRKYEYSWAPIYGEMVLPGKLGPGNLSQQIN